MVHSNERRPSFAAAALVAAASIMIAPSAPVALADQHDYDFIGQVNLNGQMWHPLQNCIVGGMGNDEITISYKPLKTDPDNHNNDMNKVHLTDVMCAVDHVSMYLDDKCIDTYVIENKAENYQYALRCCGSERNECLLYKSKSNVDLRVRFPQWIPPSGNTGVDEFPHPKICVNKGVVLDDEVDNFSNPDGEWNKACTMGEDLDGDGKGDSYIPCGEVIFGAQGEMHPACPGDRECQLIKTGMRCPIPRNFGCRWPGEPGVPGVCEGNSCTVEVWPTNAAGTNCPFGGECVTECAGNA